MKNKKNQKGFTLVELLVAISILGLIMVIAIPQISNLQTTNMNTKYKKYAESMLTSAKLYTDSYTQDMFGNNQSGCVDIPYKDMKDKDLLKDFKLEGSTCNHPGKTFIRVRKANDHYLYQSSIYCTDKSGKVVYDKQLSSTGCDDKPDTKGPTMTIDAAPTAWTKGVGVKATVRIWDEYGMLENIKIKLVWTKEGAEVGTPVEYNFKNKRYAASTSSTALTYSIEVPQNATGQYILKAIPVDVRDSVGNYQKNTVLSGAFKLDNTPPTVPTTINMYKWNNNTDTTPTSSTGLTAYIEESWSNKYIYTYASGAVDEHSSAVDGLYYKYKTTGATTNEEDIKAASRNIKVQGTSYIQWKACDKLGNCSGYSGTKTMNLDLTKPTCIVTGGNSSWINASSNPGSRTITAACNDTGGSGCATAPFSKTYSTDINTRTAGAKGNNDGGGVYDIAGNYQSCGATQTVKIDKTKPTVDTTTNSSDNVWTSGTVKITATTSDPGGSGVSAPYYYYDTDSTLRDDWDSDSTASNVVGTWSAQRNNTVYIVVRDVAGNQSDAKSAGVVKIDKTAPTVSSVTNPSGGNASVGNFSLTLKGSDAHSGIKHWQYSWDQSSWTTYASSNKSPFTTTAFTTKRNQLVYVRVCDNVGHCSSASSTTIHIVGACDSGYTKIGSYGDWGGCSKTCGDGKKYRDVNMVSTLTGESCGKRATQDEGDCNNGPCDCKHEDGSYITHKSGTYTNYKCTTRTSKKTWSDCSCGKSHTLNVGDMECKGQCIHCGKAMSYTWCPNNYNLLP